MYKIKKYILVLFVLSGSVLALGGCFLQPEIKPTEFDSAAETEKLEGLLFPFSVSIPTSTTHRLEKNEILQGYLASKIVDLSAFENLEVLVEGHWKAEKMRQIFWVEKIELKNEVKKTDEALEANKIQTQLFEGPHFSFLYPKNWDYTTGPNETLYFVDGSDMERQVFLTFSLKKESPPKVSGKIEKKEPIENLEQTFTATKKDLTQTENIKKIEERSLETPKTNLKIGNLEGQKIILHETQNLLQESLILYSNISEKNYHFSFTRLKTDQKKENQFEAILRSFVEGETLMQKQKSDYLRALAEEAKNNIPQPEETEKLEEDTETSENSEENISNKNTLEMGDSKEEADNNSEKNKNNSKENLLEAFNSEPEKQATSYQKKKVVIDSRAYIYQNQHYDIYLKVPYGYWYRNFGSKNGSKTTIGFSDKNFTTFSDAKFTLEILMGQSSETKDNRGIITLDFIKDAQSFYRFKGSEVFLPAMEAMKKHLETPR